MRADRFLNYFWPPDKFKPGCYALKMKGQLPESIAEVLPAEMRARYEWMLEEESGRANGDQRQA